MGISSIPRLVLLRLLVGLIAGIVLALTFLPSLKSLYNFYVKMYGKRIPTFITNEKKRKEMETLLFQKVWPILSRQAEAILYQLKNSRDLFEAKQILKNQYKYLLEQICHRFPSTCPR